MLNTVRNHEIWRTSLTDHQSAFLTRLSLTFSVVHFRNYCQPSGSRIYDVPPVTLAVVMFYYINQPHAGKKQSKEGNLTTGNEEESDTSSFASLFFDFSSRATELSVFRPRQKLITSYNNCVCSAMMNNFFRSKIFHLFELLK